MGRKALIIAGPDFEDIELLYPLYRLQEEGFQVDVVSSSRFGTEISGKRGYRIKLTRRPGDVLVEEYDVLVLPGGKGPEYVRVDNEIVDLVIKFIEASKVVAAICHGPQLLISACVRRPGLLKGKKVTSVLTIKDDLIGAGFEWVDEPVVVDGNLVTSRIPPDIPAWSKKLMEALRERSRE